jgi:hypothetical protein
LTVAFKKIILSSFIIGSLRKNEFLNISWDVNIYMDVWEKKNIKTIIIIIIIIKSWEEGFR